MFSQQGVVTFLWTGGEVGERFLHLLDSWGVDIVCDAAGRDDVVFIFRNPSRQRVLEMIVYMKQGGAQG